MREKCFFAYCWDDPDGVMDLMLYLKQRIEKKSNGTIQVIIDKRDFHISENFKENEKKIYMSDSVIIFFSPAYKNVINGEDEERGVYREYKHILSAWEANEIAVLPIIVEGEVKEVITKEFKDNIAADFSKTLPIIEGKSGRKKLNPEYRTDMTNLISDIIYETSVAHRRKDYQFSNIEEAYSVLFCNTESKDKLPRGCMYKSEAYSNIMSNEGANFLVGRKGSGKTTFFEVLEKYNPAEFDKHFKVLRPISVEDIREDHLYSSFSGFKEDKKVFGEEYILELFWEIYLHLCAIYIVCVEEENHRIRDGRRGIFHRIANKLKKAFNVNKLDSSDVKRSIFTESLELWENFLKVNILSYATGEAFLASMDANFNVDNVLKDFFKKRDYLCLLNAIEQCDKKILIALDKFDAISDDFRRSAKFEMQSNKESVRLEGEKKVIFDKLLYRSLILAVEKLKSNNTGMMEKAAFCIIIPQDRIDQIKIVDRDFSKRNFISLSWDAIELLQVILLRLKKMYEFDYDIKDDAVEKFREVMQKYMQTIPLKIRIETDGIKEIDLFQYILRISFWRPRDIIKYVSILYDANERNSYKGKKIDMDTLKRLLNSVTEEILDKEFYPEYDKTFFNIIDFMKEFEGKNLVMYSSELIDLIKDFKFEGVVFSEDNELLGKIRMLYEIGVIGLKFNLKEIKMIGCTLCFVFNEGVYPFERAKEDILKMHENVQIVLNPIFAKKLSLNYNTTEIIGAYGWDYLKENHIRKKGINRL